MIKYHYFLLICVCGLGAIVLLHSCKAKGKQTNRRIVGHIRSASADTATANEALLLYQEIPNRAFPPNKLDPSRSDSFFTDSEGNFDFTFKGSRGTVLDIYFPKNAQKLWNKELGRRDNFYDCGILYVE